MDVKNLVMAVVGMVLAAVMIGGTLLPAVASATVVSGSPITVSNQNFDAYYTKVSEGDVLVITDTAVTFNGAEIDTVSYRGGFYADVAMLYLNGSVIGGNVGYIIDDRGISERLTLTAGKTWTVTYTEDSINVVGSESGSDDITWTKDNVGWCFSITTEIDGEYQTIEDLRYAPAYVTNPEKQMIYSGYYDSGENDTFISYRDGKTITENSDYAVSVEFSTTLKEGTTDIYDADMEINVGDETFVPYLLLVPGEVKGHADSGPMTSLFEVLPLVAVAGLVMAGVYVFISRK